MSWEEIAGQDRAVRLLRGALERGQPHHAYLLAGPAGVGKQLLARVFAQAASCESDRAEKPCGSCAGCSAVAATSEAPVSISNSSARRLVSQRSRAI